MKKKLLKINLLLNTMLFSLMTGTIPVNATVNIDLGNPITNKVSDLEGFWNTAFDILRTLTVGVCGIIGILCVGVFAIKAYGLASAGNNPAKRSEAVQGILYSLIGIALFGGTSLLVGLSYNLLR